MLGYATVRALGSAVVFVLPYDCDDTAATSCNSRNHSDVGIICGCRVLNCQAVVLRSQDRHTAAGIVWTPQYTLE